MYILDLPAELLLRIVYYIPSIQEKCQLLETCTQFNMMLANHPACWSHLDFSPFREINNSMLLTFFKNCGIQLSSCEDPLSNAVIALDISSCKHLSENMLAALSKTFTGLKELGVNGYRLSSESEYIKSQTKSFEQLRDHVYQVLPSHGLSSMTMDLSKKTSEQLKIPFVLLAGMLQELPNLDSLSMQYQELMPPQHITHLPFIEFTHIRHIDISSCTITQPSLQAFLRIVGPNLITLKMLNIDFNHLTALCLMHCNQLECLHLSCNDKSLLRAISRTLSNMKHIKDFRMTRMWVGSIDLVVSKLNTDILERLDLSPKMNIYAKTATKTPAAQIKLAQQTSQTNGNNKHPNKTSTVATVSYATIDHDLYLTDHSLYHLGQCHRLTELRLCFPTISADGLLYFCQTKAAAGLQVFELRIKAASDGYCTGIPLLKNLKELYLYSVSLTPKTILSIASNLTKLRSLTISEGGPHLEETDMQNTLLYNLPVLRVLRLGKLNRPTCSLTESNHESNIIFTKSHPQNIWHVQ